MDIQEIRWDMVWTDLAQDRDRWQDVVSAVMNLQDPQYATNFSTSCGTVSFLGWNVLHEKI
jgi:hypothetical protein